MTTPRNFEWLATYPHCYFSRLVSDVVDILYLFLFYGCDNRPPSQRYLVRIEYRKGQVPRHMRLRPDLFLRKTCRGPIIVDKVGDARIEVPQPPERMWRFYPCRSYASSHFYVVSERPLLALVLFADRVKCLVNEGSYSVIKDVTSSYDQDFFIVPESFAACTAILLDRDLSLHVEGTLADGSSGLWTYWPK